MVNTAKHRTFFRKLCIRSLMKLKVLSCDSITVSSTGELTSVSMRYSQGGGVNTSLSRLMYCTDV